MIISISRSGHLKSCARFIIEPSEIRKKQHNFKSVHFECRMVLFYIVWEKSRLFSIECRKEMKFSPDWVGCVFQGNNWLQFENERKVCLLKRSPICPKKYILRDPGKNYRFYFLRGNQIFNICLYCWEHKYNALQWNENFLHDFLNNVQCVQLECRLLKYSCIFLYLYKSCLILVKLKYVEHNPKIGRIIMTF